MPSSREPFVPVSLATAFGRGLMLRCPRCGRGGVRRTWFKLPPECPHCGLSLDRGERDYWYGPFAVNYVVAEVLSVIIVFVIVIATWPDPPWTLTTIIGVALALLMPVAMYPFSQMMWLAVDYHFRPWTRSHH